jgi:glycosyltransferase involved in cell wall biosynthesis
MEIRLDKMIEFLSKKNHVFVLSYFGSIPNRKNITHLDMGKTSKIKMLNTILYGEKIRITIQKIIEKYDIQIIYSQEAVVINNIRRTHIKTIYDVLGLMQSESIIKDNGIEAKIKGIYYKNVENGALKTADYILTVNDAHKKKIKRKNVFVLRDGVNKIFFKKYQKKSDEKIIISFVGSFYRDRLNGIIDVMTQIVKDYENIFFEIIGDGRYIPKYRGIVKRFNCTKNIRFLGYLENDIVYKQLMNSDICFSDDWSYIGFPTKVFEYMAMGKATLVEDTPAVREIITDSKNGLLYKNASDFKKKILFLANNSQLRKKIGKQAMEDAKKHTWDKRENEFNKIFETIKNEESKIN